MAKSPYNFTSREALLSPCDLADLSGWCESQLRAIDDPIFRRLLRMLCRNLDKFVEYPKRSLLLWKGCKRTHLRGERGRPFSYPAELKLRAPSACAPRWIHDSMGLLSWLSRLPVDTDRNVKAAHMPGISTISTLESSHIVRGRKRYML